MTNHSHTSPHVQARVQPGMQPRMQPITQIVFWEPCVSPHKSAFINAVAEQFGPDVTVQCVAHEGVPGARQILGWGDGSADAPATTTIAPTNEQIDQIVSHGGDQCLHVFSGTRWFSTITTALELVRGQGRPFAIMSEPRDRAGVAGFARFVQSWMTESWLRRRVSFVLAIGRHGPPWFRSVGYRRERIFPFAYFLPPPMQAASHASRKGATVRVAYVGRLIEQKGVQHLPAAMALVGGDVRLSLIGTGELRDPLMADARRLGVPADFFGVLPIEEVQRRMRDFDVLVLPSMTKDDGWGAVVSEALMAGTAVVASSHAGASVLLDEPSIGRVVPPGDPQAIASAIRDLDGSGAFSASARQAREAWAAGRLTARAGATYFSQIVRHRVEGAERPKAFYL